MDEKTMTIILKRFKDLETRVSRLEFMSLPRKAVSREEDSHSPNSKKDKNGGE